MSTIDENGIVIDRYSEVKEKFDADLKSAFDENIKLGADSVFGQISAIVSERVSDQNELIELAANILNPQSAPGVWLSQLVKLNGIDRNEAIFSTVSLDVTANSAGTTIPAGSTVSDPSIGEKFAIDTLTVVAPNATVSTSATAVNAGFIEADAGTLTKIDNPIYGWASVTNPADASPGALEETDQELRIRRENASQGQSANVQAIYSALEDIDGVDLLRVLENNTSVTDANGVPAHSIWVIVSGGSDATIAQTIFEEKPAGCGTYGSTTVAHADSVTGETYDINFSRPTEIPIYIDFDLTKDGDYPSNGDDLIKDNTVTFFEGNFYLNGVLIQPFGLGDDVVASRLYTPANTVPGHSIVSVKIGKTASPTSSNDISIGPDEIAGTDTTKITIS